MTINGIEYVTGQDRNETKAVAHLYAGTFNNVDKPMCRRGWNRGNGFSFSIFRNNPTGGICKVCIANAALGLPPVEPKERKTKWL